MSVPVSRHQSIRGLAASRAQAQRAGLTSSPYQNSDAERVFVVRSFVRVESATAAMNSSTESTKEWNHVMDYDVTPAALGCHVSRRVCRRSNLAGRSDSIQNIFAKIVKLWKALSRSTGVEDRHS
jgi:hypothetical protein